MILSHIEIFNEYGKVDIRFIEEFEQENGVLFPESYKEFISQHNAAELGDDSPGAVCFDFFCPRQNSMDSSSFYFLGFGAKEHLVIPSLDISRRQSYDVYGYDHLITFGSNAEDDYICFDYRNRPQRKDPQILLMLHDELDPKTGKNVIYPVAEDFEEFCGLLYQEICEF